MQTRSLGYELKFPREVVNRATSWIGAAWQALPPRHAGLLWTTTADVALRSLPKEGSEFSKLFSRGNEKSLWEATGTFHDLTRNGESYENILDEYRLRADLWRGDHDVDFEELNRNHKLNITCLVLAGNISSNLEKLEGDLTLPTRNTQDLEHWMSTNINWYWNDMNAGDGEVCKRVPFNQFDSVEYSVRSSVENAWRNLRQDYFEPDEIIKDLDWHTEQKASIPGLRWENTAICAIDAVYNVIHRTDEAKSTNVIIGIADRLHKLMIKHKLWGDDTNNLDRSDGNGNPVPFDRLSKAMKENYVLITLAALSGISDYKAEHPTPVPKTVTEVDTSTIVPGILGP